MARIIEGESLLNDAAAIALAALFMEFVKAGVPDPSVQGALARFPVLLAGGVFVGWFAARIAIWIMALFSRYEQAVISVSIALPYLAYIIAEQIVGASGGHCRGCGGDDVAIGRAGAFAADDLAKPA